jgi:hypothetical protein
MTQTKTKAKAKGLPGYLVVNKNTLSVLIYRTPAGVVHATEAAATIPNNFTPEPYASIRRVAAKLEPGTYVTRVVPGRLTRKALTRPKIAVHQPIRNVAFEIRRLEGKGVDGRTMADALRRYALAPAPTPETTPGPNGPETPRAALARMTPPRDGPSSACRFSIWQAPDGPGGVDERKVGWTNSYAAAAAWMRANSALKPFTYDRQQNMRLTSALPPTEA